MWAPALDASITSMRRVNLTEPAFTYDDEEPEGFRAGMYRFGPALGAKDTGSSVYEIPPGQSICPYHYEVGEEEWLLVLSGRPTLRDPDGEHQLEPLDCVFFPTGPDGAHAVYNRTDETLRVLMYSQSVNPAVCVYPDSDKIGVFSGPESPEGSGNFPRTAAVDYYHREGAQK